jgi:hypothetical protein
MEKNRDPRTLSFVRRPDNTLQNISTLSSKTCGTRLTAFRLTVRQRYCFVAWINGVLSFDDDEYIIDQGSTKMFMCDFKMVNTR